ncbi:hypothetical protein L1987_58199 [Smallanthus sonchifolius]|uniref:Uncharacterized protein n=1 Tax=Smallanthus sonchifolius TaxID=185202 RepID=A0ACB9DEY1_9ASTR|nr:hypothetical protein L1987_58199 [Smallanthus sonchifolius]
MSYLLLPVEKLYEVQKHETRTNDESCYCNLQLPFLSEPISDSTLLSVADPTPEIENGVNKKNEEEIFKFPQRWEVIDEQSEQTNNPTDEEGGPAQDISSSALDEESETDDSPIQGASPSAQNKDAESNEGPYQNATSSAQQVVPNETGANMGTGNEDDVNHNEIIDETRGKKQVVRVGVADEHIEQGFTLLFHIGFLSLKCLS